MRRIIIATPCLYDKSDAVSIDVFGQFRFLKEAGYHAQIYTDDNRSRENGESATYHDVLEFLKDPKNIFIYHHCVFWPHGEDLVKFARCKVFMKYHNITPHEFYEKYDRNSTVATKEGSTQTKRFVTMPHFTGFMGDSEFNSAQIVNLGAPSKKVATVPPFHLVHEFDDIKFNQILLNKLLDDKINVLFVGRVVPNKGHLHLIEVINRYVDFYGVKIRLNIIGKCDTINKSYLKEVESKINQYNLGSLIHFVGNVSFQDIKTYYAGSNAFLLMSEHEGFCVPILEAQYSKLPIIALDRAAVKDTLGPEQLIKRELDYDFFASAIHQVSTDKSMREYITRAGYQNFQRFKVSKIFQKTLEVILG